MAGFNPSFRPGSQGNLGASLSQLGSNLMGLVRPFIQPTPYGTNPWAGSQPKGGQYYGPAYGNVNVAPGGLRNYGKDYKATEASQGAAAERFRPGAGFPGQQGGYSPAAERAYQQEASRVAQITAQDPELQRYELARQKAVAAGAGSTAEQSAENLGMQMWAKANPGLAAKVKPGQSGYEAIQGTLAGNAARAGQGFGMQEQLIPTPQGFPTSVPGLPEGAGFGAGFNTPQALMQTPAVPFGTQQAAQTPATSAAQSAFGQPSVLDTADFERLLQQLKK